MRRSRLEMAKLHIRAKPGLFFLHASAAESHGVSDSVFAVNGTRLLRNRNSPSEAPPSVSTSRRKISAGRMSRIPNNGGSVNNSVTRHATAIPCTAGHKLQYAATSTAKYFAISPGNAAATPTPNRSEEERRRGKERRS